MISNEKHLQAILHCTQMGQTGIRAVLPMAKNPELKKELTEQLKEYDAIEKQAQQIAHNRSWPLTGLSPAIKTMSTAMAKARLMAGNKDSQIAGMLIQGNTRGMITTLKNQHRSGSSDPVILDLSQKLLNREAVNIQKTQPFL